MWDTTCSGLHWIPQIQAHVICILVMFASCALNNGAIFLIQEKMAGGVVAGDSEKAYTANFTWYMFFSCTVAGMHFVPKNPLCQVCAALCVNATFWCQSTNWVLFILQPVEELFSAGTM